MKPLKPIYLDYNATTPADPQVVSAMLPYFTDIFGNASSTNHVYGWDAEEAVENAREQVASLIGARPGELTFTSGATEAINLALFGVCKNSRKKHIITCTTEHKAVQDTCRKLEAQGHSVTYLGVDHSGQIDLNELHEAISDDTLLVSLMYANNETGVILPMEKISEITRAKGVLLMTDATQAVGKVPFHVKELNIDIAVCSAHKLYGPKGVGALYVRRQPNLKLAPILFGGGQEKSLRPGTLNVPGIVGFGKACEICEKQMHNESEKLKSLRDHLERELSTIEGIRINGGASERLPHVSNFSIDHIDSSKLIRSLKNLAVSQGSACTSATLAPSYVLKSMGLSDELALSSLRVSMGRFTTEEDLRTAVDSIKNAVQTLKFALS